MTEAVKGVDKPSPIDRRKGDKERLWQKKGYSGGQEPTEQDDSVQISEEARQRSDGRHRKTIMEHLAETEE